MVNASLTPEAGTGRQGGRGALTPANQQLKSPAMALREIIILPHRQLRLVSKPIEKVTAERKAAYSAARFAALVNFFSTRSRFSLDR